MEEIFVTADYSKKLKKYWRVTIKYKTDLGNVECRQHINKVEWNKIIDNENEMHIEAKERLIKPVICKCSCGSYLKRYNPLLLAKVVELYKKN